MSSKIKSFYIRLFQMVAALYVGSLIGSIFERVLRCTYAHTAFKFGDIVSDIADTPVMLVMALIGNYSLPEKIVWLVLFAVCGIYAFQTKKLNWFPIVVAVLACLWTFYEASRSAL